MRDLIQKFDFCLWKEENLGCQYCLNNIQCYWAHYPTVSVWFSFILMLQFDLFIMLPTAFSRYVECFRSFLLKIILSSAQLVAMSSKIFCFLFTLSSIVSSRAYPRFYYVGYTSLKNHSFCLHLQMVMRK